MDLSTASGIAGIVSAVVGVAGLSMQFRRSRRKIESTTATASTVAQRTKMRSENDWYVPAVVVTLCAIIGFGAVFVAWWHDPSNTHRQILENTADAQDVLRMNPRNGEAYYRLGRAMYDAKRRSESISALRKSLEFSKSGEGQFRVEAKRLLEEMGESVDWRR